MPNNTQVTDTPFVLPVKGLSINLGAERGHIDPNITLETIRDDFRRWAKGED